MEETPETEEEIKVKPTANRYYNKGQALDRLGRLGKLENLEEAIKCCEKSINNAHDIYKPY